MMSILRNEPPRDARPIKAVGRLTIFATVALLDLNLPHTAAAQEYCVACTEPDALYRCVIDGARPGATASLQLLCISSLAKEGQHGTCAVRRGVTVLDCNGTLKHVAVPADAGAAVTTAAPDPQQPASAPPPPPAAAPPQDDPKTVAEMLRRAKEKSDHDWAEAQAKMKANNEKVGNFFKKSWDCMSSFFSKCSEP